MYSYVLVSILDIMVNKKTTRRGPEGMDRSDMHLLPIDFEKIRFRVEGMNSASSAEKIENELALIEGVSNIDADFTSEILSLLRLKTCPTTISEIARKISSLGFSVIDLNIQIA